MSGRRTAAVLGTYSRMVRAGRSAVVLLPQ